MESTPDIQLETSSPPSEDFLVPFHFSCYPIFMGRSPKAKPSGCLALLATFIVVSGVVAVAIFASTPKKVTLSEGADQNETEKFLFLPAYLVVDEGGARIISGEQERKLIWPDDIKLLGQTLSTLIGRDLESGADVFLENNFVVDLNFHSPDGRHVATRAGMRQDGTSGIEIKYGNKVASHVLRLTDGSSVRDARPIGWFDNETVAIFGLATSTRAIYALNLSGNVRLIAQLPEFIEQIRVSEGYVWYIGVTPGEGLEGIPRPPSELHRLGLNGVDEVIVRSETDIIDAYASRGQLISLKTSRENISPLIYLNDKFILLLEDEKYYVKNLETGNIYESGAAEKGASVFALPHASLDEIMKKK